MAARQVRRSVVISNLRVGLLAMDSDRLPLRKRKDVLHGAAATFLSDRALNSPGMTEDQIRTAFTYHVIYQAVMRSSARDPHNLVPKTFIVPDQSTAHWLGAVLDTALVTQLDLSIPERPKKQPGRPGQYKSNAEKQRAYRERLAALRRAGTFSP